MKKALIKLISIVIIISAVLPTVIFSSSRELPFTDIEKGVWYYNAVEYTYENKILSGTSKSTFEPDICMTREMFVTALAKMNKMNPDDYPDISFSDVESGKWYTPYVQWAYENKITSGIGNGLFGTGKKITRSEAVVLLYNYTEFTEKFANAPCGKNMLNSFTDSKEIPAFAQEAFAWAVQEKIVSGISSQKISPLADATRSQAAQLLMNYSKTSLPAIDRHLTVSFTQDEGEDVYSPYTSTSYGYRYGPTMIVNTDGSMDAYFSSLGAFSEWDHLNLMHMDSNGNWGLEKTVLQPTPKSYDFYSCCDPGIVYFNGYYYMGYTSTIDFNGICNNVFAARSKNPNGPFQKWNGKGWGGIPEPIISYDGTNQCWGAGEVSFVELDGTLFIYYTLKCQSGFYTMAATADSTNENWPLTIEDKGIALTQGNAQSGADIKYVEKERKFICVAVENSFSENSYIRVYDSSDGIKFTETQKLYENVFQFANNIGISGDRNGHIKSGDKIYIGYAYGDETWGRWATRIRPIEISSTRRPFTTDSQINEAHSYTPRTPGDWQTIGITTKPHNYNINLSSKEELAVYKIAPWYTRTKITDSSKVSFIIENEEIISIDKFTVIPKKVGETNVTATFEGHSVTFPIKIYPDEVNIAETFPEVSEFRAVRDTYIVGAGAVYNAQIRAYINCSDLKWGEAYNDTRAKAVFPESSYHITYSGYDPKIIQVDNNGLITPLAPGSTTVTVSLGNMSFKVTVIAK